MRSTFCGQELPFAKPLTRPNEKKPLPFREGRFTAHFTATSPVGKDTYTLAYEHAADAMSWSLIAGRLQTGQDATYTLRSLGRGQTEVTFDLTIHHNLPLPGFLRGRVIRGLVRSTVEGLKEYVEA